MYSYDVQKFDVDDCWGLVVKSNDKYFYIIALATAHKHVYNLVPRVSLSPPPRAREERPWSGLVTWL